MKRLFFVGSCMSLALLFSGCEENDSSNNENPIKSTHALIACEGVFSQGNASLSLIAKDNSVTNEVFKRANNAPLGDVVQSLTQIDGKIYAVLSNSAKVEIMSATTYKSGGSLAVGANPQYLVAFDDSLALLSHLNANTLTLINTKQNSVRKEISLPGEATYNVGPLTKVGKRLFFTKGSEVIALSLESDYAFTAKTLSASLLFNTQLCADKTGTLWGIAYHAFPKQPGDSDWDSYSYATLVSIDLQTLAITGTYKLSDTHRINYYARALAIAPTGDKLFLHVKEGSKDLIFSFDIASKLFSESPCIDLSEAGVVYPYNIGISPEGNLFVADALDFSQNGWVYEFSTSGAKIAEYNVGIAPQFFLFSNAQ